MCVICKQAICPSGCPNAPPPETAVCPHCGEIIEPGDTVYCDILTEEIVCCQFCASEQEFSEEDEGWR